MRYLRKKLTRWLPPVLLILLAGCDSNDLLHPGKETEGFFELIGYVDNPKLDEISGMETTADGGFYVHNDEGKPHLYVLNEKGMYRGKVKLDDAKNRDWEDITSIPVESERWVVVGDIGDNQARYKTIRLYFLKEPEFGPDGEVPDEVKVQHRLKARYPDGPRDCEAMAYDAGSDQILFMTKRDKPPRLYALPLQDALNQDSVELKFLAEVPTFTPATAGEKLRSGKKAEWLSQPTGMDISEDGLLAAIITYRSMYLFSREEGESWAQAFQKKPIEKYGPPGVYEEAITIDESGNRVVITTEKIPTPVYQYDLN